LKTLPLKSFAFASGASLLGGYVNSKTGNGGVNGYLDAAADSFGNAFIFESFRGFSDSETFQDSIDVLDLYSSFYDIFIPLVEYERGEELQW
jgi:hypothetical protein